MNLNKINNFIKKVAKEKIILLIIILFILIELSFVIHSWGSNVKLMNADEPQWVTNAIQEYNECKGSAITHVPLFVDLVVPFVAGIFIDTETGFAIWKTLIFVSAMILLFIVIRKSSNTWFAFILTLHFSLIINNSGQPTYSVLAMMFYIISLIIILYNKNNIGISLGILLIGSMVRLDLLFFAIAFVFLMLIFNRKSLFKIRVFKQLIIPIILYIGLIYWHGSSIISFPKTYLIRGNRSVVWYMLDYMVEKGYFNKYMVAPRMGTIPIEFIDSALVEHFGKNLEGLNALSTTEFYNSNTKLVTERYKDVIIKTPEALRIAFLIKTPLSDQRKIFFFETLFLAIFPIFILIFSLYQFKKYNKNPDGLPKLLFEELLCFNSTSKEFKLLLISSLAGFYPWLLTFPQPHYVIMAMPAAYIGISFGMTFIAKKYSYRLNTVKTIK